MCNSKVAEYGVGAPKFGMQYGYTGQGYRVLAMLCTTASTPKQSPRDMGKDS
jgi:hypothetical protein